jgi:hypothetical protein
LTSNWYYDFMLHNSGQNRFEDFEARDKGNFGFVYGLAAARLQEAFWLRATNPHYKHAWLENYPGDATDYVAIALTSNYDEFMSGRAERIDIALPVTHHEFDEDGALKSAVIAETDTARLIVATRDYDLTHRYVVSASSIVETGIEGSELYDLQSKLIGYDIVPFRIEKQST